MVLAVIIDDDPDDIRLLEDALDESYAHVRAIHYDDPIKGLRALATSDRIPEYIFIDINMPGLSGLECLRKLRRLPNFDSCVITMLSTGMNDEMSDALRSQGADYTFVKPSEYAKYHDILSAVFSGSSYNLRDHSNGQRPENL